MEKDPVAMLRQMIVEKTVEQEAEKVLLMEQFRGAYESMKPLNIVKGAVQGLIATTGLKTTIINGVLGFLAGVVIKKFANTKIIRTMVERLN